jgi:ClpP class serine protease
MAARLVDGQAAYAAASAMNAYESFRDKAASSRNMAVKDMQEIAQGRVWTGAQVHLPVARRYYWDGRTAGVGPQPPAH